MARPTSSSSYHPEAEDIDDEFFRSLDDFAPTETYKPRTPSYRSRKDQELDDFLDSIAAEPRGASQLDASPVQRVISPSRFSPGLPSPYSSSKDVRVILTFRVFRSPSARGGNPIDEFSLYYNPRDTFVDVRHDLRKLGYEPSRVSEHFPARDETKLRDYRGETVIDITGYQQKPRPVHLSRDDELRELNARIEGVRSSNEMAKQELDNQLEYLIQKKERLGSSPSQRSTSPAIASPPRRSYRDFDFDFEI